jgi:tRNA (guanine26-N2/guanine27-N2)-dimethyltransferase
MYVEGKAKIKYTDDAFLNPDGTLSRDFSVAFINAVLPGKSKALDSTAATGIRGIRYCQETKAKDETFLDINEKAFDSLKKNIKFNKIKAKAYNTSIQEFTNTTKGKFDLIDLDPFGGITPYIYDLLKVARSGSYLLATGTDTAVLCGAERKACIRLYDSVPMHNELCHETGVRIMIGYIARTAAQFNMGIDVLMSLSYLHYMRVFVRLNSGFKSAEVSVGKIGYAYHCQKCGNTYCKAGQLPESSCPSCSNKLDVAGKLWVGSLHDKAVVGSVSKYLSKHKAPRNELKLITTIGEELDIPLYYSIPRLTMKLGIGSISPDLVMEELKEKGLQVSKTHMRDSCIKTDAAVEEVEGVIMELWKRR